MKPVRFMNLLVALVQSKGLNGKIRDIQIPIRYSLSQDNTIESQEINVNKFCS